MRIRQVRPEFFTDAVTAHLPSAVQVTYVGLWCVADDAGWLAWDVPQIGALLYPYKYGPRREKLVADAGALLAEQKRLVFFDCGCAFLPKLANHQRIGGNKSFPARDAHRVHTSLDGRPSGIGRLESESGDSAPSVTGNRKVHTSTDKSARNVTVGNVTVGNGSAPAREVTVQGTNGKNGLVPLAELVTADALVAAGRKP